ncbi:hypothetical protein TNCV_3309321 [Trichonephila clavipes]|nr:hypothetical protein TNCV_4361731 [Trichonephila clavipes]GFV58586.1 hypothetical protein TNCV_3309321 [Trichonephila clavipes]
MREQSIEIEIGLKYKADFPGVRLEKMMNAGGVVEIIQATSLHIWGIRGSRDLHRSGEVSFGQRSDV